MGFVFCFFKKIESVGDGQIVDVMFSYVSIFFIFMEVSYVFVDQVWVCSEEDIRFEVKFFKDFGLERVDKNVDIGDEVFDEGDVSG